MKKVVSIILSFTLIVLATFGAAPVTSAASSGGDVPIIHISGYGSYLVRVNPDGTKTKIYPFEISDSFIEEKADILLPVFAKAFFTQQWDEFSSTLVDILVPIFEPIALNNDGEVDDNSRSDWTWSRKTLRNKKNAEGKYDATAYKFYYDWRLSPLEIADSLHKYIEDILYVTGEEEVVLYGRCLGSNVVAAYMQKYNGEHVQEVIHYASSAYGATQCSKAFTGEFHLHSDGTERLAYDFDLGLGETYSELIKSLVTLMNKTYSLDITCWAVNNVVEDIYLDIFPEILINSFATFPSYWSMVSIEDYDRAKETVFYGSDINDYSGLMEKVEDYRNNVQLKLGDISADHVQRGIEYSNIVKYGIQLLPFTENSDELADRTVTVRESSFGATTALVCDRFSDEYIEKATLDGSIDYISPDKQIDASTCFSPDSTWFIKNLEHNNFPDCVSELVYEIVNNEDYTVNSSEEYPQYLVYESESSTISPMTEENCHTEEYLNVTFFDALINFFKHLFIIIKEAIMSA